MELLLAVLDKSWLVRFVAVLLVFGLVVLAGKLLFLFSQLVDAHWAGRHGLAVTLGLLALALASLAASTYPK